MNTNQPIDPEMLSLYYDGLLSDEDNARVEAALKADPQMKQTLDSFQMFEHALQPELEDAEIDRLLSNTIQDVHQKLARPTRRSISIWDWVLAPRTLASTCVFLVMMGVGMSAVFNSADQSTAQQDSWLSRALDGFFGEGSDGADQGAVVSEADRALQTQAIAMIGGLARGALSQGVDMAADQTATITDTFKAIETRSAAAPALDVIRTTVAGTTASPEDETTEDSDSIAFLRMGMQQVVLGLSATLMTFLTLL